MGRYTVVGLETVFFQSEVKVKMSRLKQKRISNKYLHLNKANKANNKAKLQPLKGQKKTSHMKIVLHIYKKGLYKIKSFEFGEINSTLMLKT